MYCTYNRNNVASINVCTLQSAQPYRVEFEPAGFLSYIYATFILFKIIFMYVVYTGTILL